MKVSIIDYGTSNLKSVCRAFSQCGADINLVENPENVADAERLVLPGVGAFSDCAARLRAAHLDEAIVDFTDTGRPFLGICVGMQLLLDASEEYGPCDGLKVVSGNVKKIPHEDKSGCRKIPHIGWQTLCPSNNSANWKGTILDGMTVEDSVYFVHSYAAWPLDEANRLADVYHGGCRIAAALRTDSIYGCQFHPEKSGPVGLRILENFMSLS